MLKIWKKVSRRKVMNMLKRKMVKTEAVQDFSLNDGVIPLANNSNLEDEGAEDAENLEESQQEEGHEHAEEENGEN
ncbi:hypothetical protein Dimus_035942, partial [Dionaea muscipula]